MGCRYDGIDVRNCILLGGRSQVQQVLDVPFRSFHRREVQTADAEAFFSGQAYDAPDDFLVHFRVPHHAFFADVFLAGFKLGFDEGKDEGAGRQQFFHRRQDLVQRDESHVNACGVDWFRQAVFVQGAGVGPLHVDDPGVVAQLPG